MPIDAFDIMELNGNFFQENKLKSNPVRATPKHTVYHKAVPNFEKLHQDFQSNMQKKKNSRMMTVLQPFSFDQEVQRVVFFIYLFLFIFNFF